MRALKLPSVLAEAVFAVDRTAPVSPRLLAIAALGMGVPVAAGVLLGQPSTGLLVGLGAILLAGAPAQPGQPPARPAAQLAPALAAVVAATALAGLPAPDLWLILLVALAGLVSGYSRPVGGAAIRFLVYAVLGAGFLDDASGHHGSAALVFGAGALWNILLRRLIAGSGAAEPPAPASGRRAPTPAQLRAHFRKGLRTLAGWQFPLRLAIGLGIASLLRHLWPAHHFYWILLTVALLTERPVEHLPVKLVQRLLGTIGGVVVTALVLAATAASPVALAALACMLATLVPLARARSYLLYSIVATPLILVVLDIHQPAAPALLLDRLVATLIGGAIVLVLNRWFDRLLTPAAPPVAHS